MPSGRGGPWWPRAARAGCLAVGASLRAPHGGVDRRAGGQCEVQVGQQGAHVQGVGVPDEDLTEDPGIGGKQDVLPGGGVVASRGRMSAAQDEGQNTTWAGCGPGRGARGSRITGRRSTVRRHVVQCWRSQTRAMLCRRVSGWELGGVVMCRGGGGGGRDVARGLAVDGRLQCVRRAEGGEELCEERRLVGAVQQRGGTVRGGGVPHAQHAEPQL